MDAQAGSFTIVRQPTPTRQRYARGLALLCLVSSSVYGELVFTYDGFPANMTARGFITSTDGGIDGSSSYGSATSSTPAFGTMQVTGFDESGNQLSTASFSSLAMATACPASFGTVSSSNADTVPVTTERRLVLKEHINTLFGAGVTYKYNTTMNGSPWLTTRLATFVPSAYHWFSCLAPTDKGGTRGIRALFYYGTVIDGVAPGVSASVCTIGSSVLSVSFESMTTTVSQEKSLPLDVVCGAGVPVNYKLSLTSSLADGGRLSFGNGVTAAVSVDGVALPVNGDWIRLTSLSTGTKLLTIALSGSAYTSGVTTATGVLVLEML